MTKAGGVLRSWGTPLLLGVVLGGGLVLVRRTFLDRDDELVERRSPLPKQIAHSPPSFHETSQARVQPATSAPLAVDDHSSDDLVHVLGDIADLERRVAELTARPDEDCARSGACDPVFEPTQETLDRWAECAQLPIDLPAKLSGPTSPSSTWFSPDALDAIDANDGERDELELAAEEFSRTFHSRLAAIHEQVIGADDAGARPTHILLSDLRAMQGVVDADAEQRRSVALERAGHPAEGMGENGELVPFYRQLVELGDEFESAAASVVGKQRARVLRAGQGGWGSRIDNAPRCGDEQTG